MYHISYIISCFQDSVALDVGAPTADTAVGGIDNLYDKSAQRVGEIQIFRFKRLLNTGDSRDKVIRSGPMHIIFAFHPSIVEYTYHGPLRSPATYIDFFATEKSMDISYHHDTYAIRVSIIVITSLLCALPIILCILIIHNRDQPVIRASTVLFCVLITLGALVGYIAVILSAMQRTIFTCNAFFWLTGIAWVCYHHNHICTHLSCMSWPVYSYICTHVYASTCIYVDEYVY